MKAFLALLSWVSLAVAQSASSARSSSSSSSKISSGSNLQSNSSSSSSSSSWSSSLSSSILTTSAAITTSSSKPASSSSTASASLSATIISATPSANSTASTASPTPTGSATYVNPWAGNFSQPVPATGTGSEYALQCQNAYFSFTSVNTDFLTVSASLWYSTSVIRSTTVIEVHTYYTTSYYTLCDGHPRVITSAPTATSTTVLLPSSTVILVQGIGWAQLKDPNCTVSWDDCRGLWSTYTSASSAYAAVSFAQANTRVSLGPGASWWVVEGSTTTFAAPSPATISLGTEVIKSYYKKPLYLILTTPKPGGLFIEDGYKMTPGGPVVTIQHTLNFTNTPYTPHCRTEQPTCTAGAQCQINGDRVEIFYFPAQTNATRDFCATTPAEPGFITRPPTNFTWTPITTGPYTVLPGNTTWFSGNVYVSLNRINAKCTWSGTAVEVGEEHGGEILTMAPSELFSQRAYPIGTGVHSGMFDFEPSAYSFNFNDLASPYPWSAWGAGPECVMSRCTSMNGEYNPWLAVPPAIRRLDPRWSTCDLALYGLYDPPRALSSVGNVFATITSKDPIPGPTPGQSIPQSAMEPTNVPPQPSKPMDPPDPEPSQGNPDDPGKQPDPPKPQDPPPSPSQPGGNTPQNPPKPNDPPKVTNNPNPPAPGQNPNPPRPTTIGTVGGAPIVVNPTDPTRVVVGPSKTLSPGGPAITVSGTSISMADPGHIIISAPGAPAPSTINVPTPNAPRPTAGVVFTAPNGQPITATAIAGPSGSSIVVDGTLISAGGPPVTLPNGVVVSEAPSGTGLVIIDPSSGVTSTLAFSSVPGIGQSAAPTPHPTPGAVATIGGRTVTVIDAGSSLIIPELGITLTQGGPASTISGTVVSDAGTGIQIGTSTVPFSTITVVDPLVTVVPTPGAVITIGGKTYTVIDAGSSIIIPELGITLTEGGPASTISGTVISDAGTGIVVGTTTEAISTVSVTKTSTGSEVSYTGAAERMAGRSHWLGAAVWGVGCIVGIGGVWG
ncbi:hypothetical protein P154DRAFT_620262 [Amniculicola lignicola CBS 123094]|uniref:Uncharacterized protein n=1 Tax=Amniculicola lignicola CBS 123094 TaxID=1392246 RepID=A0A6A5WN09_9PLEO|nr:hypothetical protein P154DRAFT_620262 [Amniculicola lignicola CBS 123094]